MMLKHADEIKEIEQTEMTNSWEMTRRGEIIEIEWILVVGIYGCSNELKFIRDVIQVANRHSGIQHFEQ